MRKKASYMVLIGVFLLAIALCWMLFLPVIEIGIGIMIIGILLCFLGFKFFLKEKIFP